MGKIKLGNNLNIENLKLGATQIQKMYMGNTLIFPDCTLEVIGWDNLGTWISLTLYSYDSNGLNRVTHNLYYNGAPLIVGSTVSTSSVGSPIFNGSGLVYLLNVDTFSTSGSSYTINSVGVVTQITPHIT